MKKRIFYLSLLTAALVSGCIKEEGETYTIVRAIEQPDSKDETKPATVFTGVKGYMYGKAEADVIVLDTFETILKNNQLDLDCYVEMASSYSEIDINKNAAKEVGYVYSRTNNDPLIGGNDCNVTDPQKVVDESKESFTFTGAAHNLVFNAQYYMRSYFISTNDDTIYNPRVTTFKTVLPGNVWVNRNDAATRRTEPLHATLGEKVYIYGGRNGTTYYNDLWTYNKKSDTWEQLATFDGAGTYYAGCTKRCNGASFLYPIAGKDTLIYFVGGEIEEGVYTPEVFYYSVCKARFANVEDHPNYSTPYKLYNSDGTAIYEQKKDENGNLLYKDKDGNITTEAIAADQTFNEPVPDPTQQKMGNCARSHVEPLPLGIQNNKPTYGLAGMVAFSLKDDVKRRCFVAFGKNDWSKDGESQISSIVYEYDVTYDRVCNGPNESSTLTWTPHSPTNDKNAKGYYQPICIECGDKVIFGCGETNDGLLSKSFYQLMWSTSKQYLRMEEIATPPDEFVARANAAAFYLNYQKSGGDRNEYQRLYVGTGRNCTEDEYVRDPEQLLNDLWCYDFSSKEWIERSELSNIPRQGAVGFTVMRNDDYYSNTFEENQRGYISFGEGYIKGSGLSFLNDNWEYLP